MAGVAHSRSSGVQPQQPASYVHMSAACLSVWHTVCGNMHKSTAALGHYALELRQQTTAAQTNNLCPATTTAVCMASATASKATKNGNNNNKHFYFTPLSHHSQQHCHCVRFFYHCCCLFFIATVSYISNTAHKNGLRLTRMCSNFHKIHIWFWDANKKVVIFDLSRL